MIALAPGGRLLDDALVDELAAEPALTLLCGRYEGFDERIIEHFASDVVSIGRYVLAGGELAAMVAVRRGAAQAPGRARARAVGASRSPSAPRSEGAPEYPHYTRPAEYRGWRVPEVLLSGHHERDRATGGASAAASGASGRAGRALRSAPSDAPSEPPAW